MGSHRRTFITGSAGVIGRQLTADLLKSGHDVLAIDREPMPDGDWSSLRFEQGDLSEMDLSLVVDFDPGTVFHLAASFERSEESPEYWGVGWRDDVVASHRVLDAVKSASPNLSFVFASSYLVYDPAQYMLEDPDTERGALDERSRIGPRNLCGAGKYYTERELSYIKATSRPDWRIISARIYRSYGRGSRDVISRWVRAGLDGGRIEVFNRANRFDYVYADDVASSLIHLAEAADAEGVFNVASGTATSIDEVLSLLTSMGIVEPSKIDDLGDTGLHEASIADVSRLREATGWTPSTPLEAGIRQLAAAMDPSSV